jgi:hypothetical protein
LKYRRRHIIIAGFVRDPQFSLVIKNLNGGATPRHDGFIVCPCVNDRGTWHYIR